MIRISAGTCVTTCVSISTDAVIVAPVFRHRAFLKSGASRRALLSVQAAMSVGIVLTNPAHAQTILPGGGSTVYLSNYGGVGGNPFTISNGTAISTAASGVQGGNAGAYVIGNAGTVSGSSGNGIALIDGGTVSNTGTILGGIDGVDINKGNSLAGAGIVLNYGSLTTSQISGGNVGVYIGAPGGTLINGGLISESGSNSLAYAGVVMNGGYIYNGASLGLGGAGTISGFANGVLANGTTAIDIVNYGTIQGYGNPGLGWTDGIILGAAGGSISNGANALISGYTGNGILSDNGGVTVNNLGTITGSQYAIDAYHNQTIGADLDITNGGTIAGGSGGIYVSTGYASIANSGLINGAGTNGIDLYTGGSILNAGTIIGNINGIYAGGSFVNVTNGGQITGSFGSGVDLSAGGTITNGGTAVISGKYDGIYIKGGAGSVTNFGLITASKYDGVELDGGGAVNNQGSIYGAYAGVQSGYVGQTISQFTSVTNSGMIRGNTVAGILMFGNGAVNNQYGGTISVISSTGAGIVMYAGGGSVNNDGVILGGAYGAGVDLAAGGSVYNSGTITGGVGVKTGGAASYVFNDGSIIGGTIGVHLQHGGYVDNNYAGCQSNLGVIYGGLTGVEIDGAPGSVTNYGYIRGGGLNTIGTGVLLSDGGTVSNRSGVYTGTLISGRIIGGDTGVQVQGGPASIFNTGTIYGHNVGLAVLGGGAVDNTQYTGTIGLNTYTATGGITGGSTGIYGGPLASVSVTNSGFISGTYAGIALLGGGGVTNHDGEISGLGYGIRIAGPAQVSNSGLIFGEDNIGVDLESGGTISNAADGAILGQNIGVFIGTDPHGSIQTAGTVLNAGYIHASASTGIVMLSGGYVSNSATGQIIGASTGVYLYAQPAFGNSIFNAGLITGQDYGLGVGGNGVFSLANAAGGTISGDLGALIHLGSLASDAVSNAGLLLGTSGSGISLYGAAGFNLSNQAGGTIIGSRYGIYAGANEAHFTNSGTIAGTDAAMYITDGALASVTNLAGGTITSSLHGIQENAAQFSLDNAGLLNATDGTALLVEGGTLASVTNETTGTIAAYYYGLEMDAQNNQVDNKGLILAPEEYYGIQTEGTMAGLINEAGATILGGEDGIISSSDNFTLDNAGSINASYSAGVAATGTIGNVVINRAGGTITGPLAAVYLHGAYGSLQNSGVLEGQVAVAMENTSGSVLNTSTGTISGDLGVFSAGGEAVSNAGIITGSTDVGIEMADGGQVVNSGSITGAQAGVSDEGFNQSPDNSLTVFNDVYINGGLNGIQLGAGVNGQISNADGGLIEGGTYGIAIGVTSATAASFGTIFNSGDINGGQTGIVLNDGGLVSNAPTGLITGGTYAVQSGYMTGQTYDTIGIVDNAGRIAGGAGGVLLTQGGVVSNAATGIITGGTIGVQADALTDINNAGLIEGGATGVNLAAGGTVVNTGNIAGGVDGLVFADGASAVLTNSGHITGTLGTGVALAGGALNNQQTGIIRGGVDGVLADNGASIVNAGQILDAPAPGHAGVFLGGNASLVNTSTGTISGEVGVLVTGDNATVTDAGVIISTDGGDAIQVAPTADPVQITLSTGAKLTGAIDGGGTAGTITLTGQNVLDNNITNFGAGSQLTISPGAVWTGAGNWTISNVNNTGTFQGGTLNAPLNLTGNFNSAGTLQVIVTPTLSSQLIVTGAATLSGKLTYVFAPGTYTPGFKYNFLTATGGATGGFSGVTYLGATPAYVSKTTNVAFDDGVLGSNLTLGAGLLTVSPLDASIFSDANQDAALNAEAANDELLGKATADADNAAACAAAARAMPDETAPRGTSTASRLTGAVANAFCGAGGWIEATGTAMTMDNGGDTPGYTANDAGFLAGIDRPVTAAGTRLGLAVGYDDSWLNDKSGGKASAGTVRFGLYTAQPIGAFTLGADLIYGHATDTSTRVTGEGEAGGNYGGDIINGGVQLSTIAHTHGFDLTPSAGIKFAAVSTDGFAETAPPGLSPFTVKAQSSSYTSVQPYLNLKLSKTFTTESLVTITPSVTAGYALEAGNTGKSVNLIAQDGTVFASSHTNLDASAAKLAVGISAGKNNWFLYARYAAIIASNYTAQAGEAGLQINF